MFRFLRNVSLVVLPLLTFNYILKTRMMIAIKKTIQSKAFGCAFRVAKVFLQKNTLSTFTKLLQNSFNKQKNNSKKQKNS